jgi:TRAP-type C4-dicarboxylate transport system permease small subunit
MDNLKKLFTFIGNLLTWTEEAFLCLLLVAMILLACVQIFLRTFYSSGILWADPLLRYMQFMPWLRVLLNFFSASVCVLLTSAAIKFVRDESFYGGRGILDIPSWGLNLIYPVSFAIIAGRFLILALKDLAHIVLRKSTIGQT